MEIKILYTEVIDNTVENNGKVQISGISVLVEVEKDENSYSLDFQTTETCDYGAISSNLRAYDGTDDYYNLSETFDEEDDFFSFLEKVKIVSDAQNTWDNYAKENFDINSDHYGGMDANSKINEAIKR